MGVKILLRGLEASVQTVSPERQQFERWGEHCYLGIEEAWRCWGSERSTTLLTVQTKNRSSHTIGYNVLDTRSWGKN